MLAKCIFRILIIVIIFISLINIEGIQSAHADTVDQHQDNHDGNNRTMNKNQFYLGELFTPSVTANITQFCINAYTSNGFSNGNFTVEIYNTSSHLPTGSLLTSGSLSSANFPSTATATKTCITLTPVQLTSGTEYAAEFKSDINDGIRYYILQATASPSPTPSTNDSSLYSLDGTTWNQNTGEWFAYSELYLAPTPTPTPTATPTPTPTSTPTPTPTITTNNTNTGTPNNTNQNPPPTTCTNAVPMGTPDLFQINVSSDKATLYFSPISGNTTDYVITYGYRSEEKRFAVSTSLSESPGVLSYTINSLSSQTTYYFSIQAKNGCMPGNWGNEMKATTTKENDTRTGIYYKNLLSQFINIFPHKIIPLTQTNESIETSKTCKYTVQPGDSLWSIAANKLGGGWNYQQIINMNKKQYPILSPSAVLQVNLVLNLNC